MVRFEGTDERKGKGMRTVRFRIVALFVLVTIAFIVGIYEWRIEQLADAAELVRVGRVERVRNYQAVLNTRLKQLDTTVLDYTLWDDLVEYIKTKDDAFIKEQVDTSLTTMGTAALWVFDENGKLIHECGDARTTLNITKTLDPEFVKRNFATRDKVHRYFTRLEPYYSEIVGTSIHRTADTNRKGKIYGYFVVARHWKQRDLNDLGKVASAEITFRHGNLKSHRSSHEERMPTIESLPLIGRNGFAVTYIDFKSENPIAKQIYESIFQATAFLFLFALMTGTMAFVCIAFWVGKPLLYIVKGLEEDNSRLLSKILKKDDEFARIAELMQAFFDQRDSIAKHNADLEHRVIQRTKALQDAYDLTIEGWAKALELRDHETEGHSRRVTELSLMIGRKMGLTDEQLVHLRRGALLHDIGKVGIPDSILFKAGPLTADERAIMEEHPVMAYEMFKDIPFLEQALPVALHHHERWDGQGYPHGLAGEDIPLSARIFALADVWDALRSDRPYRQAWNEQRVREHIESLSGSHFDPRVVEAYLTMDERMLAIVRNEDLPDSDQQQAA